MFVRDAKSISWIKSFFAEPVNQTRGNTNIVLATAEGFRINVVCVNWAHRDMMRQTYFNTSAQGNRAAHTRDFAAGGLVDCDLGFGLAKKNIAEEPQTAFFKRKLRAQQEVVYLQLRAVASACADCQAQFLIQVRRRERDDASIKVRIIRKADGGTVKAGESVPAIRIYLRQLLRA